MKAVKDALRARATGMPTDPSLCGETMPSAVRSSRSGTTVTVGFDVVVFRSRLMPVCSADSSGRSVNISEMEGGRFSGFPASPSGAEGGGVLTLNTGVLPFFLRDHREARLGAMAGTANSTGSPAWALWTFPLVLRWYVAMGLPSTGIRSSGPTAGAAGFGAVLSPAAEKQHSESVQTREATGLG
eukprot:CAMPEP_0117662980 /NCGR_PEP_ID=MMETSP0804-20121206/8339_1 /TAXON_ID=1074897 /ORGANISM="Tetraselmis astigmatica, Strain CCMP880" /LENGTH=184 /DNA_ID=CAMNT_0005469909 /DNA_START=2720 /DNA_END=3275 /DNA_ORIENTATION=+